MAVKPSNRSTGFPKPAPQFMKPATLFRKPGPAITLPKIVIGLAVILVIVYLLFQGSGAQLISSNKTVNLALNSSINFYLPDNNTVASLFLAQSSNSSILLYLSKTPVLEKNILLLPMQKGTVANLSVYGSQYADMQVSMVSGASTGAVISISTIPKNLNIRPAILQLLNSTSFGKAITATTTIPTNSQSTTTTPSPGSSATTIASTTIVPPSVNGTTLALLDANKSIYGALMFNYNKLYIKAATTCTPSLYNSSFRISQGHAPAGPNSFANATLAVPSSITASAKKVPGGLYNVTYTATIPIGNLPAMLLQINTTTQFVSSYSFIGIFQGDNYGTALQQYQALNSSSACSPYIP